MDPSVTPDTTILTTDPLTGLLTRASFSTSACQEYERARRYQLSFALLWLDLDHFKSINDTFGHTRGDQVLVEFARRVTKLARSTDLIFRWGGDEFMILLPHTELAAAAGFATRLLETLKETPFPGDPPVSMSSSIGVAAFPVDGQTVEALLEVADRRSYTAKRLGRARVVAEDTENEGGSELNRPLEYDQILEKAQAFFKDIPRHEQAVLVGQGPTGAGHTRFLEECGKWASLRGYARLTLRCRSGLKTRQFGVLAAGLAEEPQLTGTTLTEGTLFRALEGWVKGREFTGLIITLDDPAKCDSTTLTFLRKLYGATRKYHLGYILAGGGSELVVSQLFSSGVQHRLTLAPLSEKSVQLWLRQALQEEVPPTLVSWFYSQTGGLPALIRDGLEELQTYRKYQFGGSPWERVEAFALGERLLKRRGAKPGNLPQVLPLLVGREGELEQLRNLMGSHRLVSLVAPGGTGKTRLALQSGLENLENFRDGVFFVELASSAPDRDKVVRAVLSSVDVGVTDPDPEQQLADCPPEKQLAGYLQAKEILLILDNFEHLVGLGDWLMGLLEAAPALRLLVTTRDRLKLPVEAVLELAGLTYPVPAETGETEQLEGYSAIQYFTEQARLVQPGFQVDQITASGLAQICRILQGNPLGLKLAAAWMGIFTCNELAERLEKKGLELVEQPLSEGERGMRQVFNSSWEMLSGYEQRTLAGLAVLQGGFDREAACRVSDASLFFLEALVNRAILNRTYEGRYEIHPLLQQYLVEKLKSDPDYETEVRERHACYYLTIAEEAESRLNGTSQKENLTLLETELNNLRTAIECYYDRGEIEQGLKLVAALGQFWRFKGYYREGRHYLERGLGTDEIVNDQVRARALLWAGNLTVNLGELTRAKEYLQGCLKLSEAIQYRPVIAECLSNLGIIRLRNIDYTGGEALLRASEKIWRELNDKAGLAWCLNILGQAAQARENYKQAEDFHLEGLNISLEMGDKILSALNLLNLGRAALCQENYEAAVGYWEQSLANSLEIGYKGVAAYNLSNLALVALIRQDFSRARNYYRRGLQNLQGIDVYSILLLNLSGFIFLAAGVSEQGEDLERTHLLLLATRLAGVVAVLQENTGYGLSCIERDLYHQALEKARSVLGQEAFQNAMEEGRKMALDQAIELALTI